MFSGLAASWRAIRVYPSLYSLDTYGKVVPKLIRQHAAEYLFEARLHNLPATVIQSSIYCHGR